MAPRHILALPVALCAGCYSEHDPVVCEEIALTTASGEIDGSDP